MFNIVCTFVMRSGHGNLFYYFEYDMDPEDWSKREGVHVGYVCMLCCEWLGWNEVLCIWLGVIVGCGMLGDYMLKHIYRGFWQKLRD